MAQRPLVHFFSFVLILIVIAGVVFYVNPRRDDIASLQATIDGQTAQLTSLQSEVDRLTALQSTVAIDSQQAQTLNAAIPDDLNEDDLIQAMSGLATQNHLDLHSVGFGTGMAKDSVTTFSITASLSGNYTDLGAFLKDVEGADRQYTVKGISVSIKPADTTDEDKTNDVQTTDFSVTIDAYYAAPTDTASAS